MPVPALPSQQPDLDSVCEHPRGDFTSSFAIQATLGAAARLTLAVLAELKEKEPAEALRRAEFQASSLDSTPTKLARHGILSYSALTGECQFVLLTPAAATAVGSRSQRSNSPRTARPSQGAVT